MNIESLPIHLMVGCFPLEEVIGAETVLMTVSEGCLAFYEVMK